MFALIYWCLQTQFRIHFAHLNVMIRFDLNIFSALYKLSFDVLHDHIDQYIDFVRFWGAPILRGLEKGSGGSKKWTP